MIERTAFGIKLRATVDNAAMADALGVKTQVVYAVSFALAIGLAAFGGVVGAEFLPIEPYYALRYMVTFLVVVSVGGAGSILGAVIACLVLGAVDTTGRYLMPALSALTDLPLPGPPASGEPSIPVEVELSADRLSGPARR